MSSDPAVSVVIPCYNPADYLFEAIHSVRAQTCPSVEIILVNDGTDRPESLQILQRASPLVDRYIEQENRGLGAARNSGFAAARTEFVVPLDSDDLIRPAYVRECMRTLEANPASAFACTGMEVFGRENYVDPGSGYNLYRLLDQNELRYAALIRKADWGRIGGYDESMRLGYEDWELWLRLGAHGRFGAHVAQPLFRYRKHGPSLYDTARAHHDEIVAYIREKHPELFAYENRARIKAQWMPAVCLTGPAAAQTIEDVQMIAAAGETALSQSSQAPAFLIAGPGGAEPHSAEFAALAVWGGKDSLQLPDGSTALSRRAAAGLKLPAAEGQPMKDTPPTGGSRLRRHFVNAGLNSWDAWLRHPGRSVLRLIPLRVKERINQAAGRPVFDLSFYLQFQPRSVLVGDVLIDPLRYMPRAGARRRVALVTPHLGPGGAESVLLEIAGALDRECFELLVLATQSRDARWHDRWRAASDHVYDLAPVVPPERMSAAVYSIVTNWRCDAVLVQNSLFGYAALPHIRKDAPKTLILDLVHAVDDRWDQVAATAQVGPVIDLRIAISGEVSRHLERAGVAQERIRLIPNGVDLSRFRPDPPPAAAIRKVLFAGRLDSVKRPLLLVDIARQLAALRRARDFRFVIAGDGPELASLRTRVRRQRLEDIFEFTGHVQDMPPLFAACDVLLLTSRVEGVPLVVLEALASGRPVVASKAGAIPEVVDPQCGVLIEIAKGEAARFAAALNRILDDCRLRESMGAAARHKAEAEFDRATALSAYRQLFQ